jgi:hypothetical protein
MEQDWGIPNWRNVEAYSSNLTFDQWRWQFLRRREDYREDWLRYSEESYKNNMQDFKYVPLPSGIYSWHDHFSKIADMPGCNKKYGVRFLYNPAIETAPKLGFFVGKAPFITQFIGKDSYNDKKKAGIHALSFDLTLPLQEQLSKANKYLTKLQRELYGKPKAQRKHTMKWPTYLRVIDARDSDETFEVIGNVINETTHDLLSLSAEEYDSIVDADPALLASKAHQVWQQARDVMFKLSP